jgi:hypothetical protein
MLLRGTFSPQAQDTTSKENVMLVSEVMTSAPVTVRPVTVKEALALLDMHPVPGVVRVGVIPESWLGSRSPRARS